LKLDVFEHYIILMMGLF